MSPEHGARERTLPPRLRTLADYTICERLGKGSMGVVYRAVDERTRREVALKVIAGDHEGDEDMRSRFFREALVAGELSHRNIVKVLDSGEDAGRLYIAMELLTGGTLTEFLKTEEAVDLEARVDVMIQVCQGLLVAHDAGIYHRDIKPANLFVCDDRRVKIVDFGIARLAGSDMTTTGFILGTPDFMSPEQARGRQVDARTDIFSAAAVFYLMLTRRKPFAAPDLPAVLAKVLNADPLAIRNDEAPKAIAEVVHRGLSKNPAHRQQNVAQLAAELMAAASGVSATTLRLAAKVRLEAEQLLALSNRAAELSKALELPEPVEATVWQRLASRHPALHRGPVTLGSFPLRSGVVSTVAAEVGAGLAPLRQVVASLETAHAEWGRACELQASRDFDQAAERLASARRAVPSSPLIARDIDACARSIEQRREREVLLDSRLRLADEAAARRDWAAVLAIVSEVEGVDAGNVHAGRLRVHAKRSLDADRDRTERERSQRLASAAIDDARRAGAEDRFEEGVTALEAYLEANPNAPGIVEAIAALRRDAQASVDRVVRERAQRQAAVAIDEARRAAVEGRFDEGIAVLETCLVENPDASGLPEALDALRRDQQAAAARAELIDHAARLTAEAAQHLEAGDLAGAEQHASQAVSLNASDTNARHLLERVRLETRLQAEREQKRRRVAELVQRATDASARGRFAKALSIVDEALALDVADSGAAQLREQISADRAAHEAAEMSEQLRQRRARAAAPALREARRALAAGDYSQARWLAESARAQDPDSAEVATLLEQIAAATPEPSPDDTVRLAGPDSGDTARISLPSSPLRDLAVDLSDRASAVMRRWRSSTRRTREH